FLQIKSNHRENHLRRRIGRRQNKNNIPLNAYFLRDGRHGRQNNQSRRISASITQTYPYPISNSSKRPSSETIISTQLNSRRTSKGVLNMDEV
ncbi:unnamed protein product, partial [Rotaria sordida]